MKLWTYLKQKIKKYGDRVAFANSCITYADILNYENKEKRSRKLFVCEGNTREEHAISILKCMASGNVAVPLSQEYGVKIYDNLRNVVSKGTTQDLSDVAFLMYTSGTTGKPKGVMLTDENIITNLKYISTYFDVRGMRSICIARPLVHIAVIVGELLYALCNGLTIYFYEEMFMPQRMLSYLTSNDINVFCATPTLYQSLAEANKNKVCHIKVGVISGEILSEQTGRKISMEFPDTAFYNVYGLTEHSPRVSALLPSEFRKRPNSVGKPIGAVCAEISDGELIVKSPCIMKGYYENKEGTDKKIVNGWLHTGDYAHKDEDGYLYIDGRKDSMIIRAGLNIYPDEIETSVKEFGGIEDCLVYGEKTERGTVICMKYVGDIDIKDLRKYLAMVLNPNLIPSRIEKTDSIERTASGKKKR